MEHTVPRSDSHIELGEGEESFIGGLEGLIRSHIVPQRRIIPILLHSTMTPSPTRTHIMTHTHIHSAIKSVIPICYTISMPHHNNAHMCIKPPTLFTRHAKNFPSTSRSYCCSAQVGYVQQRGAQQQPQPPQQQT